MIRWAEKLDNHEWSYLKRIWLLLYPWLAYELISFVVIMVFTMIQAFLSGGMSSGTNFISYYNSLLDKVYANYLWIALVTALITIPLMLLFMRLDRRAEEAAAMELAHWEKPAPVNYLLCFVLGASACVILNHLLMLSGLYQLLSEGFSEAAEVLYSGSLWMELLSVGILTPIAEELIFRGLIYRRMRWMMDSKFAIPFSALIFAVFHGNLLQGIYALCIGLLFAFLYERYHSILAPVLLHVGANIISVLLTDWEPLGAIYENNTSFMIATVAMMLVFVFCFYLVLTRNIPRRTDLDESVQAAD